MEDQLRRLTAAAMRVHDSGDVARARAPSSCSTASVPPAILFHDIRADCATEAAGSVPMGFLAGLSGEELPDIGGEGAARLPRFRHVEQDGEELAGGIKELVALRGVFE